jgi:hypothetical protein
MSDTGASAACFDGGLFAGFRGDIWRPCRVRRFHLPTTLLENDLRQRAGEAGHRDGFITHCLVKVIIHLGLTHGMLIGLGVLLLLVAIIGYWGSCAGMGGAARAESAGPEPDSPVSAT